MSVSLAGPLPSLEAHSECLCLLQAPFRPPKPTLNQPDVSLSNLSDDLHCLYRCSAFTDLVLVAGTTILHVHRYVLHVHRYVLHVHRYVLHVLRYVLLVYRYVLHMLRYVLQVLR